MYLIIIILVLIFLCINFNKSVISESDIIQLTNNWIHEVVINHDPERIARLFCSDGSLIGTVSQIKRKNHDIKLYFEYFAKLPNIKILSKTYNISKVTNNVFTNTAFITWLWDGIEQPITARMTFIFRDKCIFQLHSSALPDINQSLLKISGSY